MNICATTGARTGSRASREPTALTQGTPVMFPEERPHAGQGAVDTADIILPAERYALVYDVPVR